MSEFKMGPGVQHNDMTDAVPVRGDAEESLTGSNELPVNTYDDYKTWCDKIRQEWDIN